MQNWDSYINAAKATGHPNGQPHSGLGMLLRSEMPGLRYLKIGDTWHRDTALQEFLSGADLAGILANAGIRSVGIELARQLLTPSMARQTEAQARMLRTRQIDPQTYDRHRRKLWQDFETARQDWARRLPIRGLDQIGQNRLDHWDKQIHGFNAAGLTVHGIDNFQWMRDLIPGPAERLYLGDREVTDHAIAQTFPRKTAIIYGADHFRYHGTMGEFFKPDDSLHIDIYSSRRAYERIRKHFSAHSDMIPDYVYLLDEQSVERPDPDLYRRVDDPQADMYQRYKQQALNDYTNAATSDHPLADAGITKLDSTRRSYFRISPHRAARMTV